MSSYSLKEIDSNRKDDVDDAERYLLSPSATRTSLQEEELWKIESGRDRVCNHLALTLLGVVALLSVASTIGGAELLNSIHGLPFATTCKILPAVGGSAVGIGLAMFAVLVGAGNYLYHGGHLATYGACFFPASASRLVIARRVFLTGIFPFLMFGVLLALVIASITLFTLSLTVAPLSEDYTTVPGISGPITISRDANGLTHIVANSRGDAYFGQGFAQAQDRLWQLEFDRLAAKGKLAEHVGSAALKFDKSTRTLNMINAGKLLCQNISTDERTFLQNFVDGINFYLTTVTERPPEFLFMSKRLLFFHQPELFTVDDVCLAARLLQWQLSFNVNLEIQRFKIFWRTNRSYAEVDELYINQTNISHTIFTPAQLGITQGDAVAARAREAADREIEKALYDTYMTSLKAQFAGDDSSDGDGNTGGDDDDDATEMHHMDAFRLKQLHASNAWSARSSGDPASFKVCGASDPHLTINLPPVWYYSHMTFPEAPNSSVMFDTSGVSMIGIPGCHIGKTSHVSWGITMSLTDLEDLFLLVKDPNTDGAYLVDNKSTPYAYRTEVIHVKGESDTVLSVKDSVYGPVVTEIMGLPKDLDFAIWSKPLREDSTSVTAVLALSDPSIRDIRQLRDKGFGLLQSPGFSIPLGDEHGNVGYTMTGWHMQRAAGHTGKYPTLGNGSFDYKSAIPFAQLPTAIMNASESPNTVFEVSAANQKIYPDGYNYTLGYDYVFPFRGGRIQTLLQNATQNAPSQLSNSNFHRTVQTDVHSNVWDLMKRAMQANGEFVTTVATSPLAEAWFTQLVNVWDGESTKGSAFPSFFFLWMRELVTLPQDVINALKLKGYWTPTSNYPLMLLQTPTPLMERQCNSVTGGHSCAVFAAQKFIAISTQFPSASVCPSWGFDLNTLTGVHLMMHGTILQAMFERSVPKDGDYSTIDVSDFGSDLGGRMTPTAASSMRQLYDWSTPTSVSFALPGGNSGNPYSSRYDNLFGLFGDDRYVKVQVEGNLSIGDTTTSQTLSP